MTAASETRTRIVDAAEPGALEEAARILEHGGLVAIPTETVYGLAADASNGAAVAAIFAAKGRPRFNPLIAHVADRAMAARLALFDNAAERLTDAFWPGPLTLVLPLAPDAPLHPLVTAGLDTVALRVPASVFARDLIARLGRPLAAPSANPSGRVTATTAADVAAGLGGRIDLIVDAGPAPVGVESTIVRVQQGVAHILRPGGVSAEQIAALGYEVRRAGPDAPVTAPGMLAAHYAPRTRLCPNAGEVRAGEALLAFGPKRIEGADRAVLVLNLSVTGDLQEAASNLFSHLHALDRCGATAIAVEPVPDTGLGVAINDRLARAAAPVHANSGEGGDG